MVVEVGETEVGVGETRTGLGHLGCHPGIQSEPDNREARPRLRARGPSHRPPQVAGHQVCPALPIWP